MKKITKDMKIAEVVQKYPKTGEVLFKMGMGCVGCPMARAETIEQGAAMHGMDPENLVKKLNEIIAKKK